MGSFNVADAATGLSLEPGDRAVAVVLARRRGGYPDVDKASASRPMTPTYLFEAASLPIHGKADDYGRFVPDKGSLGARFAAEMTGVAGWQEFEEAGLDFHSDGLPIGRDAEFDQLAGRGRPKPQLFGIAYYAKETWDQLLAVTGAAARRDGDLAMMRRVVGDAVDAFAGAGDDQDGRRRMVKSMGVLGLRTSRYEMSGGEVVRLPHVARVLQSEEGGSVLSEDFAEWLTRDSDAMSGLHSGKVPEGFDALLEGLWEMQAARSGLSWLGKTMGPSPGTGQSLNDDVGGAFAMGTVARAARRLLGRAGEYGDPDGEDMMALRTLVAGLGALQAELEAGMAEVIAAEDGDDMEEGSGPAP